MGATCCTTCAADLIRPDDSYEISAGNANLGKGKFLSPKGNCHSRSSLNIDTDGKAHPEPQVHANTLRDDSHQVSFHGRTSFEDHERLGPMELLKAEVNELEDLSFIDGMKDENGFTVYTGYLNS